MKLGASLGVTGGGCRGVAGGPINVTTTVGALTKAGMPTAGIAVSGTSISSGDASGHWQISGGYIIVSSAGDTADLSGSPYSMTLDDGSTVSITTVADTFDCGDGDLPTILALGSATLDGKTIRGRAGADMSGTTPGSKYEFPQTFTLTTGLTIQSFDPTDTSKTSYVRRFGYRHDGDITFSGLTFRDNFIPTSDGQAAAFHRWEYTAANQSNVTIDRCHAYTANYSPRDYDGSVGRITGTAHTNGVSSSTITLNGSPDLSGVPSDSTFYLKINGSFHLIEGVDDGADTVTIDGTENIASGSPLTYVIVARPTYLNLCRSASLVVGPHLIIQDSLFEDLYDGVSFSPKGFKFIRSHIRDCFQDQISPGTGGGYDFYELTDSRFGGGVGQNTSDVDPHRDRFQMDVNSHTTTPTSAIKVTGCRFEEMDAQVNMQTIFAQTPSTLTVAPWWEIKHCIIQGYQLHGISLDFVDAKTFIKWNTIFYNTDAAGGGSTPVITLADELGAATVEGNIIHGLNKSLATDTNNATFAGTSDANIGAMLAGSAFGGSDHTTLASWTAAALPDATRQAAGQGAGTYYTFDNSAAPAGSFSGLGDGLANEPAAGYSANAVDNTNTAYARDDTGYTGAGSTTALTFRFSFYVPTSFPGTNRTIIQLHESANQRLQFYVATNGRFWLNCYDSTGATLASFQTNNSVLSADTWYTVTMSCDWSAGTGHCYLGDSVPSLAVNTVNTGTFPALSGWTFNTNRYSTAPILDFWHGPFFVESAYYDLSTEATRRNFIDASGKPTDLSAQGSPHLYFDGDETNYFTNLGSGSAVGTSGGTLAAASSSPTD